MWVGGGRLFYNIFYLHRTLLREASKGSGEGNKRVKLDSEMGLHVWENLFWKGSITMGSTCNYKKN